MRRCAAIVGVFAIVLSAAVLPGCGNDFKRTRIVEIQWESQPEPVPPGEPIVE